MACFLIFVIILIFVVNAKENRETKNREFKTLIDGSTVCIGYDFYTYEHQLRMEDPNNPEIYLLAMDPNRDGELKFTLINREKVPAEHFLQNSANWETVENIYKRAVRQRDLTRSKNDIQKQ